jgi:hypothetical protein
MRPEKRSKTEPPPPVRHASLPGAPVNYVPLDHPAARATSPREVAAEAAAYIEAMGLDAFARQYADGAAEEESAAAIARALRTPLQRAGKLVQAAEAALEHIRETEAARARVVARMPARQQRKRGAAVALLLQLLANGPVRATTVEAKAAAAGVNRHTLRNARRHLGVEPHRKGWGRGSYVVWSLPKKRS